MIANRLTDPAPDESPFDWPAFGLQDDIRPALAKALAGEKPSVLATLYDVAGGAPRGVGAQMLFAGGEMTGFLSGGCIEADVALHADAVLADGVPRRIVYGEGGPADIRLACGSRINILLERIVPSEAAATRLIAVSAERRPAIWLSDGIVRACLLKGEGADALPAALRAAATAADDGDECGHSAQPFGLFRAYSPPLRLVAVGGDPIALAVVRLAGDMGIETVLVRPKGPETSPYPGVRYMRQEVETALAVLKPDPWTAIAVLNHDLDQEHTALKAALAGGAGYVGALGSRRRIPERNARLEAAGVPVAAIERVRAPIGLPIGGKSPWEIAVSIIAEIVAATASGIESVAP
jgi:xanthine dehydrogenase accessory factor